MLRPFEILNSFLVFLGGGLCLKHAEIAALVCLRIFLSPIQPITALNFSNHGEGVSLGVGETVSVLDVAQAPKCFSRAVFSKSSRCSMNSLTFSPLGNGAEPPFVRARPSLTKISAKLLPSISMMT